MYDNNNIFAKIIRKEIPCKAIIENEHAISFYDINPMFEKHVLIIPKGPFQNILDFTKNATAAQQAGFWDCFNKTADVLGIDHDFNIIANAGANAPFVKQSVFHFHLHLMAGNRTAEFKHIIEE